MTSESCVAPSHVHVGVCVWWVGGCAGQGRTGGYVACGGSQTDHPTCLHSCQFILFFYFFKIYFVLVIVLHGST